MTVQPDLPLKGRALAELPISLDDKYTAREGRIFLTGMQALVRLPLVQRWRDAALGLGTAGFISGYRGSPLGGYDIALAKAERFLKAEDIHFEPGVNEDLAATAVWGTQQANLNGRGTRDGVFGIWYGKGPGLDRSMDVLKHANFAGTSPLGGVLAIVGDDHGCKSSTMPHQNDHNFMAAFMPFLYPADVHEFVEYGLLGLAMSRYSGCWVGFKLTSETADTSATVDLAREARPIVLPEDFEFPPGGVHIRWPDEPREMDERLQRTKGFAAQAFARANNIDRTVWDTPNPRIGIIASGKSYQDVREALRALGIDEVRAADIGLRLYKVGMPWPLEPEGVRRFCEGLDEVLVVEEKREMIEHQLKWQLFNWREDVRPTVVGKHDEQGRWLLPAENDLDVSLIAHVIAERLARVTHRPDLKAKLADFVQHEKSLAGYAAPIARTPFYCSGCPHNRSTKVPEGSRALAGIGCHYMVTKMDRATETFSQMGGEGVAWVGQNRFSKDAHVFANLGDGTYQHSGLLAVRASVAAGVNITYKILFNDAVAMTGGQHVDGGLTVPQIVAQLQAEGVRRIAVVAEDIGRYGGVTLPPDVRLLPREWMPKLQEEFRELEGCTAIIYDQVCAAEKRRRRKRGQMEDPPKRVFINEAVCEGCGDCSVQSNCVSIEPVETEFGRKRRINQSSCNKDYSCLDGFCPAFVTLEGAEIKKRTAHPELLAGVSIPDPDVPPLDEPFNALVTGIGGTGVLTLGALMGMAAHLEGKASHILDMSGLAQKGGAVLSHVRLGPDDDGLRSGRILMGTADLLLGCDAVVASGADALKPLSIRRTRAVVNADQAPVAAFVTDRTLDFRHDAVISAVRDHVSGDGFEAIPATALAERLLGDAIGANILVLGYAWQKGLVPLSREAIEEAICLNGVAIEENLTAFEWGRLVAHDPNMLGALTRSETSPELPDATLDGIIARRAEHLTDYQDAAYKRRYLALVNRARERDIAVKGEAGVLTEAVAHNFAKLLAYKDEYEVARLYTVPAFKAALDRQFDGRRAMKVHLAPPFLARIDPATGRPAKRAFGAWMFPMFRLLAGLRFLRGTVFDPFAYHADRRLERRLICDYEQDIGDVLLRLTPENYETAVEIATLPDRVRGFGPVKQAAVDAMSDARTRLLEELGNPPRWEKTSVLPRIVPRSLRPTAAP